MFLLWNWKESRNLNSGLSLSFLLPRLLNRASVSEDQQLSQTWWDKQEAWRWLEALHNSGAFILFNVKCPHCICTHFFIPWRAFYLCIYTFAVQISREERDTHAAKSILFLPPAGACVWAFCRCSWWTPWAVLLHVVLLYPQPVHRSDSYLVFTFSDSSVTFPWNWYSWHQSSTYFSNKEPDSQLTHKDTLDRSNPRALTWQTAAQMLSEVWDF